MKQRSKFLLISFLISFSHVFLATIVAMVAFPKYELFGFDHNHHLWPYLSMLTLLANIFLIGMFMVDNSFSAVLIIQSITLIIYWFIIHQIIKTIFK